MRLRMTTKNWHLPDHMHSKRSNLNGSGNVTELFGLPSQVHLDIFNASQLINKPCRHRCAHGFVRLRWFMFLTSGTASLWYMFRRRCGRSRPRPQNVISSHIIDPRVHGNLTVSEMLATTGYLFLTCRLYIGMLKISVTQT